jgi:hypothetical protein
VAVETCVTKKLAGMVSMKEAAGQMQIGVQEQAFWFNLSISSIIPLSLSSALL